ncbi:hypothetical protein [Amycolatopsis coloradensis]|nr:hypothetical protein [Amycolatopsis coloradensis]
MPQLTEETLELTTQRFLRGLRIGVLVISVAVLSTAALFRNLGAYHSLVAQFGAFAVAFALVMVEFVLLVRRKTWRRGRWAGVTAAYAAAWASGLTLPPGAVTTALDWVYGTTGWLGAILLLDLPIGYLVGFLLIHEADTVVLMMLGAPTELSILNATVAAVGALGFPFGTALGATASRSLARKAHQAAADAEAIQAEEAVAEAVHARRRERVADLANTAEPLLRGLADGTAKPVNPAVRRACAIEAARMRRLFAETDEVDNPLRHELEHCIDLADQRGVLVDFEVQGAWTAVPLLVRRALTDGPLQILATANSWARVTVVGSAGLVAVGAVGDCAPVDVVMDPAVPNVSFRAIFDQNVTWAEATWLITPSQPS